MFVYKVTFQDNLPVIAILIPGEKEATGLHGWKYADKKKTQKIYQYVFVNANNKVEALQKALEKVQEMESRRG